VADHYNCSASDILSNKRPKEIIIPRHMVMYLCRQMTDSTLQSIGKFLGGRDHSTVNSGINNILKLIDEDEEIKNTVEILKKKLNFT
jgi:ATPase involved in DNA replication initiation